jgi:hypothetical protein
MQQPMPYSPQRPQNQSSGSQLWIVVLVVLGGLVVFGGILAVLAISGVRKYLQNAKMAEALSSVSAIGRAAETSYETESPPTLCARASKPVPESINMVTGKKYQSSSVDWSRDAAANAGFACLHFDVDVPQYYQYDYDTTGSASRQAEGDGFRAIAKGDLNGDRHTSSFILTGRIGKSGALEINPSIAQTDPTE